MLKQKAGRVVAYVSRPVRRGYGKISRAFWQSKAGKYISDRKWLQRSLAGFMVVGFVLSIIIAVTSSASAAVTFRSSTTGSTTGSTSLVVGTPAGAVAGDVLVAGIVARHSGVAGFAITPPSGFTLIQSNATGTASTDIVQETYYHVLTAAPLTDYIWTFNASVKSVGTIGSYIGADTSNPIDASSGQNNPASTSLTAASVTTTLANGYLIGIWGVPGIEVLDPPLDMTLRHNVSTPAGAASTKATILVGDMTLGAAGATGNKNATSGGAALSTAQLVALKPPAPSLLVQSAYRFFQNADQATYSSQTSNPTTGTDAAYATVSDGSFSYTAGYESTGANDWRIEKRNLSDGLLVTGFGSSGSLSLALSAADDRVNSIATDGQYIYVYGYDSSISSTNQQMRLEKRNATTGALCSSSANCAAGAFNGTGIVTVNPSTGSDKGTGVVVEGGYVYVAGVDAAPGNNQIRIEKYNGATGLICSSTVNCSVGVFGTAGVVTSNPSAGDDFVQSITFRDGYVYVAGYDSIGGSSDHQWRIEKRNAITGAICSNTTNCAVGVFGTAGVVNSNPSGSLEGVSPGQDAIKIDDNYMYVTGTENTLPTANLKWRLEKYNKVTGLICSSTTNCPAGVFGTSGSITIDPGGANDDTPTALAVDASNIYWGGNERSLDGGFASWRVEKRSIASGSLVTGFGNAGVYISNPSTNHDEIRSMFLHDGGLFIAGYDVVPGNYEIRLEKISTVDAGLAGPSMTPLVAQNTAATNIASGTAFRLRMLVRATVSPASSGGLGLKLQYAERGADGVCDTTFTNESYADVGGSGAITYNVNPSMTNGIPAWRTSADPTDGANPVIPQRYHSSNPFTNPNAIPVNSNGEWDFSLRNNNAPGGKAYCFRIINSDDTLMSSYSSMPQITTPTPTLEQSGFRWFQNVDGTNAITTLTAVDTAGDVGEYTSVAMGSDGFTRIAYRDFTNASLKYARCTNATCTTSTTTTIDSGSSLGMFNDIAIAPDGFARISYYDSTNGDLKYAQCTNADCTTKVITIMDSLGDVGDMTSIAIGSDGFARISYRDFTNQTLKYARCTNAACSTSVLTVADTAKNIGKSSLQLASDGFARIAYYDFTTNDMLYAQCTNIDCGTKVITTVDSAGDVGESVSLSLGSDDFARISYHDFTNGDLKYARCTNASCSTKVLTVVDSAGSVGFYNAIGLGPDGFARIAYEDGTNGDAKFARCNDADCTSSTKTVIDSGAPSSTVGSYLSAVIAPDGFARVAYYDFTNQDLKLATCTTADCSSGTNNDPGAALAAQNTAANITDVTQPFRLRKLIHVGIEQLGLSGRTFKLQFAARGADNACDVSFTGETYADVTATSAIRFFDNTVNTDGSNIKTTANDPTHGATAHPNRPQTYEELNNFTNAQSAISAGEDGLWDFALKDNGSPGGVFCFRIVNSDGSTLNTYSALAEISLPLSNATPAAPTLSVPAGGATGVSINPVFNLKTTDAENDYLRYRIDVCSNSTCSAIVRTIDQTASQAGWTGQDAQTGTAYIGSSTLASSTLASHTYQAPALLSGTQYWWRASAIDPGGSNTFGPASSIATFTTSGGATQSTDIRGGTTIRGGTRFGN